MLNTDQITRILHEVCLRQKMDLRGEIIQSLDLNHRHYAGTEINEFKRDLTEAANAAHIQMLEYALPPAEFLEFIKSNSYPLLIFRRNRDSYLPQLIDSHKEGFLVTTFGEHTSTQADWPIKDVLSSYVANNEVRFFTTIRLENLVSPNEDDKEVVPSPLWRFIKLLSAERKDIMYILFYAIVVGLVSLVLPLGIQTTMELISGGVFFSSVYVLIGGVIVGVLLTGGLQVFQITLVEYLQRRVFTKAAFEFAYRLPRIKFEVIEKHYAPELVNRFFDVLTVQKGLPKFLIEFSGAAIQIMFGLLLLSLYHPSFVVFGITLLGVLFAIFYLMGPKGLKTSIMESKYKYQVIHWLEDIGRSIHGFKLTGSTNLPIRKTDYYVNNYLKNRKGHFQVLLTQFGYIILFKALTIGGLLIIGTNLVVAREITLGQFVASEVIIILILNSVEKIIMYTDVVYDLLTAVDKIGVVTDLPLEKRGGTDMVSEKTQHPFGVEVKNLTYFHEQKPALKNISLQILPGERACIAGMAGSGKSTFVNIITGLLPEFLGSVTVNGYSLRDLDLTFYRDHISANGSVEEIFDGTWMENISVGNPSVNTESVLSAIALTGLTDEVNTLPHGLDTKVISSGRGMASSTAHKLLLARCLARPARLTIIHDHFSAFGRKEKMALLQQLLQLNSTLIFISNDPEVMAASTQLILFEKGELKTQGTYPELFSKGLLTEFLNHHEHVGNHEK